MCAYVLIINSHTVHTFIVYTFCIRPFILSSDHGPNAVLDFEGALMMSPRHGSLVKDNQNSITYMHTYNTSVIHTHVLYLQLMQDIYIDIFLRTVELIHTCLYVCFNKNKNISILYERFSQMTTRRISLQ